jgi:hypothetical protein
MPTIILTLKAFKTACIYIMEWNLFLVCGFFMHVLGSCISLCCFLTLPNNLFFTQIIKQSINYISCFIIHDCPPTFGQVSDPTLEEICWFGREEVVEPILELIVIVQGNSAYLQCRFFAHSKRLHFTTILKKW